MFTFTIGIPAYNEENTIQQLLKSIFDQKKTPEYVVKQIIVLSDGSDDSTFEKANAVANELVEVVCDSQRLGKSTRINQLLQRNTSDYIILIDADTILASDCLSKVSIMLKNNNIDFFSCEIQPREATSIFQKSINASVAITQIISKIWNNGDNVLACHGPFIGVCHSLSNKINVPPTIGNDAYIYFYLKKLGAKFGYCKSAKVLYSTPTNFRDHFKQSVRFQKSKKKMTSYFGTITTRNYKIPRKVLIQSFFRLSPVTYIYLSIYVITQTFLRIKQILSDIDYKDGLWDIAKSTK